METKERIIVALDGISEVEAMNLASDLKGRVWGFKVNDLFTRAGPDIIKWLKIYGNIFLDLKFHDIPSTVANHAKRIAAIQGIKIFSVHASGGLKMMKKAVENKGNCEVFAVTILDSLSAKNCQFIYGKSFGEKIPQLAREANIAGVDGIICPARILESLNSTLGLQNLKKIAVGIRPTWAPKDEHIYPVSPSVTFKAGAHKLVIGRPITRPPPEIGSPINALERIIEEIETQ